MKICFGILLVIREGFMFITSAILLLWNDRQIQKIGNKIKVIEGKLPGLRQNIYRNELTKNHKLFSFGISCIFATENIFLH